MGHDGRFCRFGAELSGLTSQLKYYSVTERLKRSFPPLSFCYTLTHVGLERLACLFVYAPFPTLHEQASIHSFVWNMIAKLCLFCPEPGQGHSKCISGKPHSQGLSFFRIHFCSYLIFSYKPIRWVSPLKWDEKFAKRPLITRNVRPNDCLVPHSFSPNFALREYCNVPIINPELIHRCFTIVSLRYISSKVNSRTRCTWLEGGRQVNITMVSFVPLFITFST